MPETKRPWFALPVWTISIAFWIACVFMTHMPRPPSFTDVIVSDKIKHFCGYGTLATLIYFSLWIRGWGRWTLPIIVLVILAAYGALDEITQPPFGRTCDLYDWYADMCGVTAAMIIWTFVRTMTRSLPN